MIRDSKEMPKPGDCLRECTCLCKEDLVLSQGCGPCTGRYYCAVDDEFLAAVMEHNNITNNQ